MKKSFCRIAPLALLAMVAALATTATPAKATLLSTLIDNGGTLQVGDKLFSGFQYKSSGDMPAAGGVNVSPFTDGMGNYGIEFQGAFLDFLGNGGSDALIKFKVTVLDPSKEIVGVNLSGNPDVVGGNGVMSVTESFLPDVTTATLNIYDITPGAQKLADSIMLGQGYKTFNVQKDILGFSAGGVATMSFLRQAFVQADGPIIPEPATATMMIVGLGAVCLVGLRKRRV